MIKRLCHDKFMNLNEEIQINQWGQNLKEINHFIDFFSELSLIEKRQYLMDLSYLILQSKPENTDIDEAINSSGLKQTYTVCIILKKNGLKLFSFEKAINLPDNELNKCLTLFLYLFRISYLRRYEKEKNNTDKWWYWDLAIEKNINNILENIK